MSQEIIDRLNELLEAERAGVQLATEFVTAFSKRYAEGELKKFIATRPSTLSSGSIGYPPTIPVTWKLITISETCRSTTSMETSWNGCRTSP